MKTFLKILSVIFCVFCAGFCFYSAYKNVVIANYGTCVFHVVGGLCWLYNMKFLNEKIIQ